MWTQGWCHWPTNAELCGFVSLSLDTIDNPNQGMWYALQLTDPEGNVVLTHTHTHTLYKCKPILQNEGALHVTCPSWCIFNMISVFQMMHTLWS